ncbi:MCP four helix bundle domain-containing protein, partial [Vibrio diabolicus]|nr:MCP four helix bundle domain-containing protein [Vibrio diabolicus]
QIAGNIRKRNEIARELEAYGKTVWPGEEEQTFKRIMRNWEIYLGTMDQYNTAMLANDKVKAQPILASSLSAFQDLDAELGELIQVLKKAMEDNKRHILTSVNDLSTSSITSNIIILVMMIAMTLVLTRLICGPLKLVVEQAN